MALVFKMVRAIYLYIKFNLWKFSWPLLLIWVVAGCLPDPLEVKNIPKLKPEIVVATQIIPDQSLVVLLTKTFSALDADTDSDPESLLQTIGVADAVVTLIGPAGTNTLSALGNGLYGGLNIPFKAGEAYTLRVNSPTMGEVYATTTVMPQILFNDIKANLYLNGFGDTLAQITYSVQDPLEKNYYLLNVQEVEREDLIQNIINPRAFTRLEEDTAFNGKLFQDQFRVFPRDYAPGDTIAVSLSNVSADYYKFLRLRLDNRYSFVEFLSEPVNYPTNIIGGKGFFNLYIPDFRIFVLEEPE